jgi:hypothetical protein
LNEVLHLSALCSISAWAGYVVTCTRIASRMQQA